MNPKGFVKVLPSPGAWRGGTGYLLSRTRALTGEHCVRSADAGSIVCDDPEREQPIEVDVLWRGRGEIDVALLGWAEPVSFAVAIPTLEARGFETTSFETNGWSLAIEDRPGVEGSLTHITGTAQQCSPAAESFQVTIDQEIRDLQKWQGASGAPILQRGGRGYLLGVLRGVRGAFTNVHFATPVGAALRDPAFRRELGSEIALERRARLIEKIDGLLGRSPRVRSAIADERRIATTGAESLARHLVDDSDAVEVLTALNNVHRSLLAAEPPTRAEAKVLAEVVACVVPLLVEAEVLHTFPNVEGAAELRLPLATLTFAELAVAAYDGRASRFDLRPDDSPDGLGRLSLPPEEGLDVGARLSLADYEKHLADNLLTNSQRSVLARIKDSREVSRQVFRSVDARFRFEAESGDLRLRRYLVYDSQFAEDRVDFLSEIRDRLPSIHLIELQGVDLAREVEWTLPLSELLRRDAQGDAPR